MTGEIISREEIIAELIKALDDEKARESIMYTLADIGEPAIPYILKLLDSESIETQQTAVRILGRIGGITVPLLINLTNNRHHLVRYEAIRYLGRLDHQAYSALTALKQLRKDESPLIRNKAQWAINRIKKNYHEHTISVQLPELFAKYKRNEISIPEVAKVVKSFGRKGKYVLDSFCEAQDEEQFLFFFRVYDYLILTKIFKINTDVYQKIREDQTKLDLLKRYRDACTFYGLPLIYESPWKYNYIFNLTNYSECRFLWQVDEDDNEVEEIYHFFREVADENPWQYTYSFIRFIILLDEKNRFQDLLDFYEEYYPLYASELKFKHRKVLEEYIAIRKTHIPDISTNAFKK